jgi:hypothetical protein
MRGTDTQQSSMFSYLSPEERVPANHPLRPIRRMVDEALKALSPGFNRLYSACGRPSIPFGEIVASITLTGVIYGAQRTDVDGDVGVQPVVSMVRWLEYG